MKITVGQFNVKSKAVEDNYLQMEALIKRAIDHGFEMIVFGEYILTGYGCKDLFKSRDFINEVNYYQKKVQSFANRIIIVFGGLTSQEEGLSNTAIIYNKDEVFYSFKENLNKREVDEKRYFKKGKNNLITINQQNFLVTFKEDLIKVDKKIFDKLIVLDSSPINDDFKINSRKLVIYANTIGVTAVDKVVWINGGNSYIKDNDKRYGFDMALDTGIIKKVNDKTIVSKLYGLTSAIKVWSDQTFGINKKWVLGASGGLDSAVTTTLLSISLGSENVITYNLASKYNKDLTINNAKLLSEKLKIKHIESSIQALVDQTYKTLSGFGYFEISSFDQENVQARTRGNLLSAFSAIEDAVICNNGNKLELALGYATIYGDTIGALSLIGDLSKVDVFQLAEEINDYFNDEIIPINLLPKVDNYSITWDMPPSAELKEDQVDPMKWFYHDLLLDLILTTSPEKILKGYLDNQFADLEIGKWLKFYGLLEGKSFIDDFNWFFRTMQINHFKRLQTPPVLAYGNKVIGVDYKESANILPKSRLFLSLKEQILDKY